VASDLEGRYVLTSVTHRFDRRAGFISEFSTDLPAVHSKRNDATAIWGVVTRVDDPESLGRVQVSLPALGTIETGWMGVLAAGAGSGKGMVALPDVGDQVLVFPIDGDLAQGIVLGGLYGVHGPGDYGVEGTAVRRYTIATPGGQRVRLDDTGQSIRLENKGGSFVDLSPQRVHIHSAVDLEIDAPGRAISIAGKSIDFKQA
jgi:phage baseplate assembly protein V